MEGPPKELIASLTKRAAFAENLCLQLADVATKLAEVAKWYVDNDCEAPAANPQRLADATSAISEANARISQAVAALAAMGMSPTRK